MTIDKTETRDYNEEKKSKEKDTQPQVLHRYKSVTNEFGSEGPKQTETPSVTKSPAPRWHKHSSCSGEALLLSAREAGSPPLVRPHGGDRQVCLGRWGVLL